MHKISMHFTKTKTKYFHPDLGPQIAALVTPAAGRYITSKSWPLCFTPLFTSCSSKNGGKTD